MISIGTIDPNKSITAAALTRQFYARMKAGTGPSRLFYKNGFHYVLTHAPDATYAEINRIDGGAWDDANFATLFNDLTYALQEFHSRRLGEAIADMSLVA